MPHVVIEYSANLEAEIEPMRLVSAVHEAVLAQAIFEAPGVRTRAARREQFLIADGDPSHAFVAVTARIGPGAHAGGAQGRLRGGYGRALWRVGAHLPKPRPHPLRRSDGA